MGDNRRINCYRKIGEVDYDQSEHYHVVFNMSQMSLKKACGMIRTLLGSCVV